MAKKSEIEIRRNSRLEDIEDELDDAMSRLDGANQRIDDLLVSVEESGQASIPAGEPQDGPSGEKGNSSGDSE